YVCSFVIGIVYTVAGSAAQIVLMQVVARDRLVEAHAKNALANSGAEVCGPGVAGVLLKLVGAPLALLVDAVLVSISALILRGLAIQEQPAPRRGTEGAAVQFWGELRAGVRFVGHHRLLVTLAVVVGAWQACYNAALVVQILFATRTLGLSEQAVGLSYTAMGVGTVFASVIGDRVSRRLGPGPCLLAGIAICGCGWLLLSLAPASAWGVAAFAATLMMFSTGAVFIFINFLALRQAVTPAPLLGRMTSTMRWLILVPAGPGALLGGWLGQHSGLRTSLAVAGVGSLLLAFAASRVGVVRGIKRLPSPDEVEAWLDAEAGVAPAAIV
ncbi:MAG TPA: MFS transporter, partial [Caldimonas sp.]|nr:MFS transporter [Caldimonas sp.]